MDTLRTYIFKAVSQTIIVFDLIPESERHSAQGFLVTNATPIFDSSLAHYPTRWVPLASVVDLLHIPNNRARIDQYREAMKHGERFPPVSVLACGPIYLLADGHKRLSAYRMLGESGILVEIWTLGRWFQDQRRQFSSKTRMQRDLLLRSFVDPAARVALGRLCLDTWAHWKRVACSLASLPLFGSKR